MYINFFKDLPNLTQLKISFKAYICFKSETYFKFLRYLKMGLFSLFGKSTILYFPGSVTFFKAPELFDLYQKIFSKLGLNFKIIEKQISSGLPALESGYDLTARKIARRNFEIFKEEEISEIITNSPEDYKTFLKDYPNMIPDWNITPLNLWLRILERLQSKPRLIKYNASENITYHDSCYLGRYCEIYEEPRKILELIGYNLIEMPDAKAESMCCGSCGGLPRINPELANEIARERILQAKRIGVKKIVVASVENYLLLKKNVKENEIEILELSEVLASALGIKKKEQIIEEKSAIDSEEISTDKAIKKEESETDSEAN
jgi:Fe-S oxidoreductase